MQLPCFHEWRLYTRASASAARRAGGVPFDWLVLLRALNEIHIWDTQTGRSRRVARDILYYSEFEFRFPEKDGRSDDDTAANGPFKVAPLDAQGGKVFWQRAWWK